MYSVEMVGNISNISRSIRSYTMHVMHAILCMQRADEYVKIHRLMRQWNTCSACQNNKNEIFQNLSRHELG